MIIAGYQVFNEVDYLKQSLESIYPFVDKIVIYETCYKTMAVVLKPNRVTKDGLSGDGTTELIKTFYDPDRKIEYHPMGFSNCDEYVTYTKILKAANIGDWLWYIGGDEVYPPEVASELVRIMNDGEYHAVWLYHYLFWHDFKHFVDSPLNHLMIYKKISNSMFHDIRTSEVSWTDDNNDRFSYQRLEQFNYICHFHGQEFKSFLPSRDDFYYHHYAYVRNIQRLLEKVLWQYYMMVMPRKNDEYNHSLQFSSPLEFKINTFHWFTNHESEYIKRYEDQHTDYMNDHPMSLIKWNEQPYKISLSEASTYVNALPFSAFNINERGEVESEL